VTEVEDHPLRRLERWIEDAREAGLAEPASVAFVTAGADARPSARTATVKRITAESLVFTSALWTLKAREIAENPHVALLFHWPSLGRQVHVTAQARVGSDALADELWEERDLRHRWRRSSPARASSSPRSAPFRPAWPTSCASRRPHLRAHPTGARWS
jgi:pyridoxamine 5'-phosphate oxidase